MVSFSGRPSGALPALILLVSLAVQTCSAAMAAWWTTIGPQVIRQNETTGAIMYSACNSNNTPVFPNDPPNLLSLAYEPRNGTALTGKGWWDNTKTSASIFYQNKDGDLVNSFHECNPKTGKFNKLNDRIISDGAPTPHNTTGLASVLISDKDGYRIYYHDANKTIQSIGYDPKGNSFYYAGVVSRDVTPGFALGAQFNAPRNVSVVYPRDSENIGVSRINQDGRYWLSSTPRPLAGNVTSNTNLTNATSIQLDSQATTNFSLASWTGSPKAIELSIDSVTTRSIFWIGADRALHQISNINWVWRPVATNQSTQIWPLADEPGADFALASDIPSSIVRIYYLVNKTLTEIKFDTDGFWKPAAAVALVNTTAPGPPPPNPGGNSGGSATQTPVPQDNGDGSGQLSVGAKAGVGVGVAVGVLAVMGAVLVVCLMRRKQRAQAEAEAEAAAQAEDEKRRQAAIAAHQQQQQQYYYGGSDAGTTYPRSYGSPPPQTPFSDGAASMYGMDQKSIGSPPPAPQELHSSVAAYELGDGRYTTHELPEQRQTLEMEGTLAESQGLMQNGQQNHPRT